MRLSHPGGLERWIQQVRDIPRLDREEEHALALRARAGDRRAVDALIRANARHVVAIAIRYRGYGLRLEDLIAEGNIGLMIAAQKFDPERGTRFVTYAGYWIRAYILNTIVRSSTMVGAGSGPLRSKLFFRLRRERARALSLVGEDSQSIDLLARKFGTTRERMVKMLRRLDARDVSLSAELYKDSNTTLLDTLVADETPQDVEYINAEHQQAIAGEVAQALQNLDPRERFIVERRMMQPDEMSLAALGRKLGVSRERVRQLEVRARKKLRESLQQCCAHVLAA